MSVQVYQSHDEEGSCSVKKTILFSLLYHKIVYITFTQMIIAHCFGK